MADADELDDDAYERMLHEVTGKKLHAPKQRESMNTSEDDLFNAIKTIPLAIDKRSLYGGVQAKTLVAPLHKAARERVIGKAGYAELRKDLSGWSNVVEERRLNPHGSVFDEHTDDILKHKSSAEKTLAFQAYGPKTALEERMSKILATSRHVLSNDAELTAAEQEIVQAMDVAEAKAKLDLLRKSRALAGYKQQKDAHKAKIKSKKYRRHERKAKSRNMVRAVEAMLKSNPELARQKVDELEKQRVLKRAVLRERASKFCTGLKRYAKSAKTPNQSLEDAIKLVRELKPESGNGIESDSDSTKDDDDDEGDSSAKDLWNNILVDGAPATSEASSKETPTTMISTKEDVVANWSSIMKSRRMENVRARKLGAAASSDRQDEDVQNLEPDVDSSVREDPSAEKIQPIKAMNRAVETNDTEVMISTSLPKLDKKRRRLSALETDSPNTSTKEIECKTIRLDSDALMDENLFSIGQDDADNDESADIDDNEEEKVPDKEADTTLPGWGSWTGPGIVQSAEKKKKKRPKKEATTKPPTKSNGKVIAVNAQVAFNKYLPKQVPFPFTHEEDYTAKMSHPIGRDWISARAHKELVKNARTSSGGAVILPVQKVSRKLL